MTPLIKSTRNTKWTYWFLGFFILPFNGISTLTVDAVTPGLKTSSEFTVVVNGTPVWVEEYKTDLPLDTLPEWFTRAPYIQSQQEAHLANVSAGGRVSIQIGVNHAIERYTIRPQSRGIKADVEGNGLSFSCGSPIHLVVEINNLPPLFLFINPVEIDPPLPGDPHVRYFGPGVHQVGMIELKDNDILYIAEDAVVYGALKGSPTNAKIVGRGILDGRFEHRLVYLENAQNVLFEGVILRSGKSWQNTLVNCENIIYRNVKVLSFSNNGDGINPLGSKNITIDRCFFRCTDDCIAIKSPNPDMIVENIRVQHSTMIGFAYSDGLTIGFETNGPSISDVVVTDCDILMARGGSQVGGHSAFSIICDGPAVISEVLFENIRVEEEVLKLFELHITDGTKYQENPPGHIRSIVLKNVTWASERPIILHGFNAEHQVVDVTFDHCKVAGVVLTGTSHPSFQINEFVRDVKFR